MKKISQILAIATAIITLAIYAGTPQTAHSQVVLDYVGTSIVNGELAVRVDFDGGTPTEVVASGSYDFTGSFTQTNTADVIRFSTRAFDGVTIGAGNSWTLGSHRSIYRST
ncbi:MAG: hypothetical protein AAF571_08090 [Verrucomicrobiota bacterium]